MKTLKDLEPRKAANYAHFNDLRDAAKELIKAMENCLEENEDNYSSGFTFEDKNLYLYQEHEASDIDGAIKILKYFFNLEDKI